MRPQRAGMTFLEVVAAMALLGVVTASLFGVFGFVTGGQLRQNQQLAAAEVANRLMLQYLDEPTKMPDTSTLMEYGPPEHPAKFRWEYTEQPVAFVEVMGDARETTRSSPLSPDRFRQITVRAWLAEESGGSRVPDVSTPVVTLTRLVDPMFPRNPDSFMNMLQDPAGFEQYMQQMMGFQGGVTTRGNVAQPNTPQRGPRGNGQFGQGQMRPGQAFQQGGPRQRIMGPGFGQGGPGRGGQGPGGRGPAGTNGNTRTTVGGAPR